MDNPVNYTMKYITLYGQPCKLYEKHPYRDNPVNYTDNPIKPCKLYEIHM